MNMHGIIEPAQTHAVRRASPRQTIRDWLWQRRIILSVVVLPTLLAALYFFLIASNQYESEAHFLVHSVDASPQLGAAANPLLSLTGVTAARDDAMSVADYLTSHDAVEMLRKRNHLVQRFQRDNIDLGSRLWGGDDPTPERLLKYYRKQVKVEYNTETGITVLKVHAFTPQDAYDISKLLLALGEQRVNQLNQRSYSDAVSQGQKQLKEAEDEMTANQAKMTQFRQARSDVDPQASGQAQINLVSLLSGQLSAARAQLNGMNGLISPSSPQYVALQRRVQALTAQVNAQSGKLTGSSQTIAGNLGEYEELQLRQNFLAKRYDAAATSLTSAREQAIRQQLYIVRVVDANMPGKSLYPERWRIVGTIAISLLLVYSIGWLVVAGVREHAA